MKSEKWWVRALVFTAFAFCFVAAGAGRANGQESGLVKYGTLDGRLDHLYSYGELNGKYANIFRELGRTFAIVLVAQHKNGKYTDDKLAVYELTNPDKIEGWQFPIAVSSDSCCSGIKVSFVYRDSEMRFEVSHASGGNKTAFYETTLKNLYYMRLLKTYSGPVCGDGYLSLSQPGKAGAYVYFEQERLLQIWYRKQEPPDNYKLMAPMYVVPVTDNNGKALTKPMPIADTGCELYLASDGKIYSRQRK